MNKQKKYIAVGNWYNKETGQPLTSIAEISEGIGKTNGKPYQITSTDSTETIDGTFPVGTILEATITLNTSTATQANLKIKEAN